MLQSALDKRVFASNVTNNLTTVSSECYGVVFITFYTYLTNVVAMGAV